MTLLETIKDKWLTWRTGKDAEERAWQDWCDANINHKANTVEDYFYSFKHLIQVDPNKVYDMNCPFGWTHVEHFKQYGYPNRELGQNTICMWFRCIEGNWDRKHHINELGGTDYLFVATNNDRDAIMISLKYS